MTRLIVAIGLVVLCIPALIYLSWFVHCVLGRVCASHARRFCRRNCLEVSRSRWQPAFDKPGVKTESTLVQLDCLDMQRQRKLLLLLVWPFGVRKVVSEEQYPQSFDAQWPPSKT
jgi:hypothetical protein